MRTTATNKKIRELLTGIRNETLIPKPEFQRRLVWRNEDKLHFLDTVLQGYPFPEIYIAAGDVDLKTGEGTEWLVDGQQRITTLNQYFLASDQLVLSNAVHTILPYSELSQEEKKAFLEYEVVVRDLGKMSISDIKEIFQRINATSYSLNIMEGYNAQFNGEFKKFAVEIAQHPFFESHNVFRGADINRMRDTSFVLVFIITIMSTYFSGNDGLEDFLTRYNEEFERAEQIRKEIEEVFLFIEECSFNNSSRAWKKVDLLNLMVEIHKITMVHKVAINPKDVSERLKKFYHNVDSSASLDKSDLTEEEVLDIETYVRAAIQGTNGKSARVKRGNIIQKVILGKTFNEEFEQGLFNFE